MYKVDTRKLFVLDSCKRWGAPKEVINFINGDESLKSESEKTCSKAAYEHAKKHGADKLFRDICLSWDMSADREYMVDYEMGL